MFSNVQSKGQGEVDETGAWLSIGDLMSGLLMVFALLLVAALVQISEAHEETQETRMIIIKGINDSLEEAGIQVQADPETGDISIMDSVLFDQNDYKLKESGQDFLERFIPIYAGVVFQSERVADEIVRIVIEGHSSSEGAFSHNMELSVLRANSVSRFISGMAFEHKPKFFEKIAITGRGPIEADQSQALASDRKVKFRFQFKDEEFLGNFTEVQRVER
ncbi:OmpA/MotB family protein [Ferrimonas balearica]|uniref:OmpA/MotB family protein n=1 Tax=Ferrimonas balearica TaxID=44012 RepID=UPI001F3C783A|nr:OmpA family protein [Ferrimonas balearica]MBY6093965.1 OmpA family protein [Ferrimonas balearica]